MLHLKHALNLFYSQSIIYEYLTWSLTGAFALGGSAYSLNDPSSYLLVTVMLHTILK